ncbi:MAG: isochorismatase family protein [Bacteroidota bacterium]|nr:isochorismatase family protein [Kiloniellaceae bacterium]
MVASPPRIKAATGFLVVDVQERLAPAIPSAPEVVSRIAALIDRASELGLPILASEQYSRGLGATVPELRRRLPAAAVIEKIHFAAPREEAFVAALAASGLSHVVVAGMEAHVCVQQTVLALLARGIAVTLVADAVASRRDLDRRVALARLARAGAALSDSATILACWPALSPATP